jgi:ABC-type uncharacterized transport system ATPase subunit
LARGDDVSRPDEVIVASGLTKRFGGVIALNDFSFNVPKRQIRCVVGPNGAGKSTLFRVMAGLMRPDSGRLTILGREVTALPARVIARMGVATKLQIPRIFESLTVREHLLLAGLARARPPQLLGLSSRAATADIRANVDELLDALSLGSHGGRTGRELGHGERQWLEIGMMLATNPTVLLLDEPGAGMAPSEKEKTAELFRRLTERITLLVIEHDLAFVHLIADEVLVMHRGELLAQGSFDEISAHPEVARVYLGTTEA